MASASQSVSPAGQTDLLVGYLGADADDVRFLSGIEPGGTGTRVWVSQISLPPCRRSPWR